MMKQLASALAPTFLRRVELPGLKTSEHHVWLYDPLLLLLSSEHLLWLPHFYAEWAPGDAPIRLRLALGKLLLSRASDSG